MIILFSSCARKDVVNDEQFEFNKIQSCLSDSVVWVVTSGVSGGVAAKAFDDIEDLYYSKVHDSDRQPPFYRFDQGVSQNTPEEISLFSLIKAAYVNGGFDPDFVVTFLSNQKDILTKKNTNDIEIAINGNRLLHFIK